MNCIYCGADNNAASKYCVKCGRKLRNQYCSACGSPLLNDPKFCPKCGKPVGEVKNLEKAKTASNSITSSPNPTRDKKERPPLKKSWLILAAGCAVFVIILVVSLASTPGNGGVTGKLNTGVQAQVAEGSVGPEGGVITAESGQLSGMTITVPEGAYENQIDFMVSEAPITSQTFGEDFKPISPLISVNNGEVFAAEPLEVTVPIHLEEGQFAMGFYYNAEAGTLEGIPLLDETDSSITLMTRHFSDIYIAVADMGIILDWAADGINTGFEPGKNDFITPNTGSYVKPKGFCVGACIAELYYYMQAKRGGQWSGQLYGRFDNNGLGDTPNYGNDDANVIRLCSMMHYVETPNWYYGKEVTEYHKFRQQSNDEKTFYALAYAMMGSGEPQLVYCAEKNGNTAHMVLAYKIENDVIYIADPNYPADVSAERTITYDRTAAGGPKLSPYYSAVNAEEAQKAGQKPYDMIAYYGMYALVDQLTANGIWQNFLDGKTPGVGVFPGDLKFTAFTGMQETDTGETVKDLAAFENGLTLHESRLKDTAAAGGKLFFQVAYPAEVLNAGAGFNVYIGTQEQKVDEIPSMEGFYSIQLQPGENDLGIYYGAVNPQYTVQGRFVNFYRFKIIYDNGSGVAQTAAATVSGQTAEGFEGSWQMYTGKLLQVQGSESTMSYVNALFSQYGGTSTLFGSAYSSLDDYINAQNEGYTRELIEFEKRNLVITKNADGTYSAVRTYSTEDSNGNVLKSDTITFDQAEVSGNTITFQRTYETGDFTGREAYELTLDGDTLTGLKYLPFLHPYASNDDITQATGGDDSSTILGPMTEWETVSNGTPEGYNPEEVWSFEAVRVQ